MQVTLQTYLDRLDLIEQQKKEMQQRRILLEKNIQEISIQYEQQILFQCDKIA